MRSDGLAVSLLRVKVALTAATPVAALAAEQTMRAAAATSLPALTWCFVVGFSLLGWAVAELDKVAELWDLEGKSPYEKWRTRLTLVKGIAASVLAGVLTFFLGTLAPNVVVPMLGVQAAATPQIPEMLLLIFTTGAGYMGARWFEWFERKFFTR